MSNVIPFNFNNHNVRVIQGKDGEPWFAAKDVAAILGYANPQKAIRDHCKGVNETFTPSSGGTQKTKIIPERDVYRLIMRSKLPSAEAFEEWVVGEVLPTIRKTGSYNLQQTIPHTLPEALRLAAEAIEERDKLKPKAEALDRIATSDGGMCVTNAAKDLQIKPKELFSWLRAYRWIYKRAGGKNWTAYQDKLQARVLEHKVTTVERPDGSEKTVEQVLITPKGLAKLSKLLNAQGAT